MITKYNNVKVYVLVLIIVIIIYLLMKYNRCENMQDYNELIEIIKNSNSNEIVKHISETMHGSTMHHHYHILYDIRTVMGKEKKIYTEIGSYNGGSTSLMLHHDYETEINCIDPLHLDRTDRSIIEKNIEKYNKHNYTVNIYQKFSTDQTFLNELRMNNFKTDILFIDGDHSYDTVIKDFYNFEKFVNVNGYIIFDDYEDWKDSPDVKRAVDDIVKNLGDNYKVIGSLDNIQNAYDGLDSKKSNEFILFKIK